MVCLVHEGLPKGTISKALERIGGPVIDEQRPYSGSILSKTTVELVSCMDAQVLFYALLRLPNLNPQFPKAPSTQGIPASSLIVQKLFDLGGIIEPLSRCTSSRNKAEGEHMRSNVAV